MITKLHVISQIELHVIMARQHIHQNERNLEKSLTNIKKRVPTKPNRQLIFKNTCKQNQIVNEYLKTNANEPKIVNEYFKTNTNEPKLVNEYFKTNANETKIFNKYFKRQQIKPKTSTNISK